MKLRNFGQTWSFSPREWLFPRSEREIADAVCAARKVRVVGSAHSWSRGVITDHTLLSLDRMNRIVHVDRAALRVTVQAGIKLKQLIAQLAKLGLALSNLGSIADQSLAGAIATGTHGSGRNFRCLADQVEAFRLIDGEGRERRFTRGQGDFDAALVGLGCFGVVYQVTLAVVPCFQLHAITDMAPYEHVVDCLDTYVKSYDHFKFWWLVPTDKVILFQNNRTERPRNDSTLKRWFKDELLAVLVYRSLVKLQGLDRERLVPLVNEQLGEQVGKRFDRVCQSHIGFLTPSPPVHRETEWAFDCADAKPLLRAYRKLLVQSGFSYNFIQEIRFTKADPYWLSPAYQRDSIWLSMYNMDEDHRWQQQLRLFEQFAREHGGRPHWGKEASFDRTYSLSQWPQLPAFSALARSYDPKARFVNEWAAQALGLAG
jgi:L-gulonolactone oxidase